MFSASSKTLSVSSSAPSDPYFNQVSTLIHANGTDGKQNNTLVTQSPSGVTFTATGNATQCSFSPYETNWSCYFASGNYFSGTSTMPDVGTGDWTMEGWVWPSTTTTVAGTGNFFTFGSWGPSMQLSSTGCPRLVQSNIGLILDSTTPILAFRWSHIAICKSSGTSRIFLNGVKIAEGIDNQNYYQQSTFGIGATATGTVPAAGFYGSNFRFSNTALYISDFTPSTTPLTQLASTAVLCLHKNSHIITGNYTTGLYATLSGPPQCVTFSPFSPSTAYDPEIHGGSLACDGTGDAATTTFTDFPLSSDFTIECWYYGYGALGGGIFSQRTQSSTEFSPIELRITTTNTISLLATTNGITWQLNATSSASAPIISRYAWHHIVLTRSGSAWRVFVDGILLLSSTLAGTLYQSPAGMVVGARGTDISTPINGFISDFRLVSGTVVYPTSSTTIGAKIFTPPTSKLTNITNTVFLLNFDNAGLYDSKRFYRHFEPVGNARVSTVNSKFGGSSLFMDNTGGTLSYLRAPINPLWTIATTEDFCVEGWYNITYSSGSIFLWSLGAAAISCMVNTNNIQVVRGSTNIVIMTATYAVPLNTWTHIAICRYNGYFYVYVNGTSIGTPVLNTTAYTSTTNGVTIGSHGSSTVIATSLSGYVDDFRITIGHPRYTANFTAPTAQLPSK